MERLLLARHAHSRSNERDVVSSQPPGEGLSGIGREQALALHEVLAGEQIDLGVASRLLRAQETLTIGLGERDVDRRALPELDDIHFGAFDGGPLAAYRAWAWSTPPDGDCPGGGESRVEAALRFARGLDALLALEERVVLAVSHALPVHYMVVSAEGRFPAARIGRIPHATPFVLDRAQLVVAATTLRRWAREPQFADAPDGV